ncbi:MAG: hypothetical protein WCI05_09445 [Myxococcales bacterium]
MGNKVKNPFEQTTVMADARKSLETTAPLAAGTPVPAPLTLNASPPDLWGSAPAPQAPPQEPVPLQPLQTSEVPLEGEAKAKPAADDLPTDRAALLVEAQKQLDKMRLILAKLRETPK